VLAVGFLLAYGAEHSLALPSPFAPDLFFPALVYGFLSWLGILLAISTLATLGAAFSPAPEASPVCRFLFGLLWVIGTSTLLLTAGKLSTITALLVLLPLPWAMVKSRGWPGFGLFRGIRLPEGCILAVSGAALAVCAGTPSLTHDDHVYHLQAVKEFAETGSLWTLSPQPNVYRPLAHAVFSAWGAMFGLDRLKPWASAFFLVAAQLICLSRGGNAGRLTLLAWISVPQWFFLAGSGYAEPLLCLLVFLLLRITDDDHWSRHPRESFSAAAAAAGMLPGVKYGGLLLLPCLFFLLGGKLTRENARRFGAIFLMATLCTAAPFYLRNTLFSGNPLYPHGSVTLLPPMSGFPGSALVASAPPLIGFSYQDFTDHFGMGHDFSDLLKAPVNVTFFSHFHSREFPLTFFDGQIGFIPLTACLLALFFPLSAGMRLPALLACLGILWPAWLAGSHQIRFLLPLVAVSLWLPGTILARPPHDPTATAPENRRHIWFWLGLFLLAGVWSWGYSVNRIHRYAPFVSGHIPREDFLSRHLPFFPAFSWASHHLKTGRLLVLLEERTLFLDCPYSWTSIIPTAFANFLHAHPSSEAAAGSLRAQGITHILLPRFGLDVFRDISEDEHYRSVFSGFFRDRLTIAFEDRFFLIFSWKGER
jgi:hypothetical protein